jgi:eukaryotic-like serine/threonine-protein kinase
MQIGTRLGAYEVIAKLGEGGMGEVYKARDTRLDRTVAIKTLSAALAKDAEFRERFDREARTISRLNHPNICTIFDVGRHGDRAYVVLEFIDGETLAERLARSGGRGLPLSDAVTIASQLCDALEAAHRAGITHRDVKPGNIMLTATRTGTLTAKLLDFGLAKHITTDVEHSADATLAPATRVGVIVGTGAYMSPEQAEGRPIDGRSDLFSLGAVLYELIAGRPAFDGTSVVSVIASVLRSDPVPLMQCRADVPRALDAVVTRCLQKDPTARFSSAADVQRALAAVPTETSGRTSSDSRDSPSIAVLPFTNLSADKDNEYFSDGLADEILNALTRLKGLRVIARTSSFAFRNQHEAVRTIGQRLNVSAVLEGSVRRAGARVRVSVQLVDVATESPIWSERFDREMTDVFALQDEIAQAVVSALEVRLTPRDRERLVKRHTENVDAYNLFLKGRFLMAKVTTRDSMALGRSYLERAIAADPAYPLPYVELAHAYFGDCMFGVRPPHEGMALVRVSAARALAIDATLAEGHTFIGLVKTMYDYEWDAGLRDFHRAMDLNPGSGVTHMLHGSVLMAMRRVDEALAAFGRALESDPFSPLAQICAAMIRNLIGDHEAALEHARLALEVEPNYAMALANVARAFSARGRHDEAVDLLERAAPHAAAWVTGWLGVAYVQAGRRPDAERLAAAFEERQQRGEYVAPAAAAVTYAALGNVSKALEWLEHVYEVRDPNLCALTLEPALRSIHLEPRYRAVLRKLRLE